MRLDLSRRKFQTSFMIDHKLYELLRMFATEAGKSKASIIRSALRDYFERNRIKLPSE